MKGRKAFFFSLSHSGDMAICAVGPKELGADVESIQRMERFFREDSTANAFLSRIACEKERIWYQGLTEAEQRKGLLRLWTGKESYGKRNGLGIAQGLVNTNVLDEEQYLFLQLKEEYYLSVCMDTVREEGYRLIPIDVAKEYIK